ncbi:MAG: hypothetical protein PVI99_04015 [Anaerolineales bacterium]|jgi:hypothetical protein
MKKSNVIGGIICLAIAALLTVLNLTLSEDKLMFMVSGQNMPWVPPVVLGIIGIILLATASEKDEEEKAPIVVDEEKVALNKRLETMAWGFFLIMLGGFFFVPHETISKGVWSIGVGVIMLGLNVARYFNQIKMSGFTTVLGILSILGGVLQLFGMEGYEGAILLIILGAYVIAKPWFERRQLFGKAEEGAPSGE